MPNVGYATLQIIPSVRGISDELRRQLIGPAGDAGDQAGQQSSSAFSEKWKAGLAVAGAAAGAVLVAATVSAVEKERMADRLSAQLGLTGKGAKQAGEVAGSLYSRAVVDSFEDGAAAVRAVMGSGLIDEKATTRAIESITTKVADLASTFDQDLVGTTNAATQLIRTGLAKDAPAALDLLTKGLQSSADKAGDFMDTVNEYATQFRKAGLDGATAIGLLNQAIRAGARDSDIAADAIKEFSIRAVDGSTTTAQGFNDLGLSGVKMAKDFAKGGSTANAVLDLTLDRLRGIEDPVKQSRIAVALFGTQAEDLGSALLAMDPSAAAAGLGKVGGAAKEVGDTIRGNTATELKILQRQLMSGLGVVVRAVVLPALQGLISALGWTGGAIAATGRWFQEWGVWLAPIALLIGGITIALNAQAIATGLVTAVFSVYRAAILTGTAVTQGFAAAQAVLNAVMALNPFVLIAIAVVALGAALVIAWKKSETFKNIVMAAWQGIQTAAMWAWTTILKPMIDGLIVGWKAVATGALWLWNTVLKPVFGFISTAARIVATIYAVVFLVAFKVWWTGVKLYAGLVMTALRAVGNAAVWLWEKAISPVISFIVGAFQLWWTGVKLYFALVSAGFKTVGGWVLWLYHKAVKPVFDLVLAAVSLAWAGVKLVFGYFTAGLKTVGGWARWLWEKAVSPAMNGIKNVVSAVWNTGVKLTLNTMKTAIGQVGVAFAAAKDAIKLAWDKVKGIAKAPVQFIVDTVYNRGLVGVWNKVAGAFGAPKLSTFKFASGGILPGYTPGRDPHRFYSPSGMALELSGGESIMRPEFTRGAGAGFVGYFNRLAKSRGAQGVKEALAPVLGGNPVTSTDMSLRYANGGVVQRFADGGIFGWIKSAGSAVLGAGSAAWNKIKDSAKWLTDTLEASARAGVKAVVDPLLRNFPGMSSGFGQMLRRIPTRMIDALFGYSREADKKGAGGIGGPKAQSALRWARTQNGLPYQWGGNGNPSWDCLTLSSVITTPEGHKALRDLQPGEQVLAFQDGRIVSSRVLAKWNTGEQQLYKVRTRNRALRATGGHRVLVAAPVRRPMTDLNERVALTEWGTEWKHVRDLTTSDYLVTYIGSPKEGGEDVPEDLAWLMGLWLADGSVHTSGGIRICVYDGLAEKAMSVLRKHSPNRRVSHHPRHGVMVSDIQRAKWMIRNGFCGKSHERTIPAVVMQWSQQAQTAFLHGYADGDGSYKGGGSFDTAPLITYKATSHELVEGIREMHLRRGDRVTVTRTEKRSKDIIIGGKKIKNARPIHSIDVAPGRGSDQTTGAGHRPGLLRLVEQLRAENLSVQKVLSVEPDGIEETWDIEVEDSHSFISDGLVSHNCSGFMSAIESVLRGQKPHRRWSTHAFQGGAPPGWVKNGASSFKVGITHAGVGHTAGTLGGVNVESRGGDGVVVGPRARGYNNRLFTSWYGFQPGKYDSGGWLRPGVTAAVNATGQPEAVLTASQWRVMSTAAAGSQAPITVEVHTRDAALADFIDVRVHRNNQELAAVITAS